MTSLRKLEEEIARTKDPIVRKQLQELIDNREQRWDKTINDAKEIGDSVLCEIEKAQPQMQLWFGIAFIAGVAITLIFLFLQWVGFMD